VLEAAGMCRYRVVCMYKIRFRFHLSGVRPPPILLGLTQLPLPSKLTVDRSCLSVAWDEPWFEATQKSVDPDDSKEGFGLELGTKEGEGASVCGYVIV
jgi:hypothetical protein